MRRSPRRGDEGWSPTRGESVVTTTTQEGEFGVPPGRSAATFDVRASGMSVEDASAASSFFISLISPRNTARKSVVSGKRVSVRVDIGGRRIMQKKKKNNN